VRRTSEEGPSEAANLANETPGEIRPHGPAKRVLLSERTTAFTRSSKANACATNAVN
jgi:hypothetical protein